VAQAENQGSAVQSDGLRRSAGLKASSAEGFGLTVDPHDLRAHMDLSRSLIA
jgi:hypothetical protein